MVITGASKEQITKALETANMSFDGNITFKRIDFDRKRRDGREVYNVTLTVKSSYDSGSRRSHTGRRIAAACWHAHGTFMDSLPDSCEISTSTANGVQTVRPGERWQDWNAGSEYRPARASQLCACCH